MELISSFAVIFISIFIFFIAANETIRGTRDYEDALQGGKIPHESERGAATIKAALTTVQVGMFVSRVGETEPEVDLAVATDMEGAEYVYQPANLPQVLRGDPDWNIDTAFAAGIKLETFLLGCGAIVPVILEGLAGPVAVVKGDIAVLGLTAGKVRKWAYTDASEQLDTLVERVGTFMESDAGHATEDRILLVRLD